MGTELNLLKELSTISITSAELAAVASIIRSEIGSADFNADFDDLMLDMQANYEVVLENLLPLTQLLSQEDFSDNFARLSEHYNSHYLSEVSRPRIYVENTFQKYLQFRKRKEVSTGYPILKISFARLHDYIDKWIDNDIWLAMTIDIVFKLVNRWLLEVAELQKKDDEMAYALYLSLKDNLADQLQIIEKQLASMQRGSSTPTLGHLVQKLA